MSEPLSLRQSNTKTARLTDSPGSLLLTVSLALCVILYVCPPQCPAGLVKMPKWLRAITLDLPMALPHSIGKWTSACCSAPRAAACCMVELRRQLSL